MNQLNEAFSVSRGKDERGNVIAFIDPSKPENVKSFEFRQVFKDHGAKWNPTGKYWYWYVGKTEDQWRNVFSKFIEPALKAVHGKEGATEDDSKAAIVASLDALISQIETTPIASPETKLSSEEESQIKNRLQAFKQRLVNIDNDEDFKKAMSAITKFKNAQGYKFSFGNAILILIQNPKATIVNSKSNWEKVYNRTVKPDARPLMVYAPNTGGGGGMSPEKKKEVEQNFLKKVGKTTKDQLTPNEKITLQSLQRGYNYARSFTFVSVYDVADTEQIEGKEDFIKGTEERNKLKWHETNKTDERVRPIYSALVNIIQNHGIKFSTVTDLGGSRGVSKSGEINILQNEGNDVGLTKTLAHELAHEFLHQKYLGSKDQELGRYFIGKEEGKESVEQQAEIAAWMIMDAFGFDVKTTSLNYALLWGGDKEKMVKVFDTVANVVNKIIDDINTEIKKNVTETSGQPQLGQHVTPQDVANFIGVGSEYNQEVKRESMLENFYRKVNFIR